MAACSARHRSAPSSAVLRVWWAHLVNGRTASGKSGSAQNPSSLSTVRSLWPAVTTTGERSR